MQNCKQSNSILIASVARARASRSSSHIDDATQKVFNTPLVASHIAFKGAKTMTRAHLSSEFVGSPGAFRDASSPRSASAPSVAALGDMCARCACRARARRPRARRARGGMTRRGQDSSSNHFYFTVPRLDSRLEPPRLTASDARANVPEYARTRRRVTARDGSLGPEMARGHANVSAELAERDGDVVERGGTRRIAARHPGEGDAIETLDDVTQNGASVEDVGEDVDGARGGEIGDGGGDVARPEFSTSEPSNVVGGVLGV